MSTVRRSFVGKVKLKAQEKCSRLGRCPPLLEAWPTRQATVSTSNLEWSGITINS